MEGEELGNENILFRSYISLVKRFQFFIIFFDLGSLQTIRRVFDTDKLAFTELLGVPNAIRGVYLNDWARSKLLSRYRI